MITALVIAAPAILGALIFNKIKRGNKRYTKLITLIIHTFFLGGISNFFIRIGLWIIGMRSFSLSEMGLSFKMVYCALECIIILFLLAIYLLLCKESRQTAIHNIKQVMPEVILFVITFCVFVPSSLFLKNISEFPINYLAILPSIILVSMAIVVILIGISIIFNNVKAVCHYAGVLFSVGIGIYLQSNFLNPELPLMEGKRIDWSAYVKEGIVSLTVWTICIVGVQILLWIRENRTKRIADYISYFLAAVQTVTLFVLIITAGENGATDYIITREDEFTIGTGNNVVMFILDSFDSSDYEAIVASDEQFADDLENFTYFDNIVGGGAATPIGTPLLLTGIEYDPTWTSYDEYLKEAWRDTELYSDLNKNNYDVRIFTESSLVTELEDGMVDNAAFVKEGYYISSYYEFTKQLYKFVCFNTMPQILKEPFWFYTDDLLENITNGEREFYFNDVEFYNNIQKGDLRTKYSDTVRIYHLFGAHVPYTMNENVERVTEEETSEEQQIQGSMKIVFAYIDKLKELGVYDQSTIIITADHGTARVHDKRNGQNPTLLIKMAGEEHSYEVNSAPIHNRNVVATIAKVTLEDYSAYGPSIFDIDENSDVERMHTIRYNIGPEELTKGIKTETGHIRFITSNDARDLENIVHYDPYTLNRVEYRLGDIITFDENNEYCDDITYRLYKENNTGIASNELNLCFVLNNYVEGDVKFSFTYADIYNDTQKIKIYAHGERMEDVICERNGIGKENTIIIPEECIENGILPIRMVFPNAVTPHQLNGTNSDTRVLSVAFETMYIH